VRFDPPLLRGHFVRRYKRFFVDVRLADGSLVTAHCPNTGSLMGCLLEGAEVWIQPTTDPKRSLRFTWKLVRIGAAMVGVDTGLAVPLVEAAIAAGTLDRLAGHERVLREVVYGRENTSRIDLLLSSGGVMPREEGPRRGKRRLLPEGDQRVYVEVKNTTLVRERLALFPDAVTERGQKHLAELMDVVAQGMRAAMVFCVQRDDCSSLAPADDIDPSYGRLLRQAAASGVEIYALQAAPNPEGIVTCGKIPVALD